MLLGVGIHNHQLHVGIMIPVSCSWYQAIVLAEENFSSEIPGRALMNIVR